MKKLKLIAVFLFTFSFTGLLQAQISLAPSFVFLDKNSGIGTLYVSNNSQKTFEVTINFAFGYPGSDPDGNLVMNYQDSAAYKNYALDNKLRAFPRIFTLKGGEQRTVRLQVIQSQQRNDGFYFTRMKIMAKPQTAEVTDSVAKGIDTKINFNFEQITAVFYHKGNVNTGLNVKKIDVRQNNGMLELRPELERTGNSPYIGSMYAKLKNSSGKVVAETQSTTTVYFDEIRRMDLKLENVIPGSYTMELSFETRRNDMNPNDLVQAKRIIKETKVDIK